MADEFTNDRNSGSRKRPRSGASSKGRYWPRDGAGWTKRTIEGPGIWATCVKGKEKQTVGELYDLFESLASDIWPLGDVVEDANVASGDEDSDQDINIEAQIAKEVAAMKRPKLESRFSNCQTRTPCVVFLSCKAPIDPVRLVVTHVKNVQKTGVSRTRYTHRLVPSCGTCAANLPDIDELCKNVFNAFLRGNPGPWSYKIELRIRNHNTHTRDVLIQRIAKCLPSDLTVDLDDPQIFILVEVFKASELDPVALRVLPFYQNVCGLSVVKDYYKLQKFNIMGVGKRQGINSNFDGGQGRISGSKREGDVASHQGGSSPAQGHPSGGPSEANGFVET